MSTAAITHAIAEGTGTAACGAPAPGGWGRLHPVYGSDNVSCAACRAVLAQRYMAAVPLASTVAA